MKTFKVTDHLEENWSESAKEQLNLQMAQTKAMVDAGNLIWDAIQRQGWSQKELAEKMNVTEEYVSRLLGGMENLSVSTLARTLAILGEDLVLSTTKQGHFLKNPPKKSV